MIFTQTRGRRTGDDARRTSRSPPERSGQSRRRTPGRLARRCVRTAPAPAPGAEYKRQYGAAAARSRQQQWRGEQKRRAGLIGRAPLPKAGGGRGGEPACSSRGRCVRSRRPQQRGSARRCGLRPLDADALTIARESVNSFTRPTCTSAIKPPAPGKLWDATMGMTSTTASINGRLRLRNDDQALEQPCPVRSFAGIGTGAIASPATYAPDDGSASLYLSAIGHGEATPLDHHRRKPMKPAKRRSASAGYATAGEQFMAKWCSDDHDWLQNHRDGLCTFNPDGANSPTMATAAVEPSRCGRLIPASSLITWRGATQPGWLNAWSRRCRRWDAARHAVTTSKACNIRSQHRFQRRQQAENVSSSASEILESGHPAACWRWRTQASPFLNADGRRIVTAMAAASGALVGAEASASSAVSTRSRPQQDKSASGCRNEICSTRWKIYTSAVNIER